MSFAVIIMGSKSDWQVVKECIVVLERFSIPYEVYVSSAHRSAQRTIEIVRECDERGAKVFIGAAGMAAHLAGSIAANTLKPVIAIALPSGMLDGLDSLLSSVQMPKGMPVATMSVGRAGAINAGYFVAQMFALFPEYAHILEALESEKEATSQQLLEDTRAIRKMIKEEMRGDSV